MEYTKKIGISAIIIGVLIIIISSLAKENLVFGTSYKEYAICSVIFIIIGIIMIITKENIIEKRQDIE